MLFISPPFGNYLSLDKTTSIKGSFTLLPRQGLVLQILKTLRYSFFYSGWVNKIGLRNKGIDWAVKNHNVQDICSIAICKEDEIDCIKSKIPTNLNIEINISCPNVEKETINKGLQNFLNDKRKWCILKLSPITKFSDIDNYYKMGFRQFHCCNTIPIEEGGLSGKNIKPISIKMISYIKNKYNDSEIIAGGGIQNIEDIEDYKKAGADHFSVSSLCFNPFLFMKLYYNYKD